MFDLLAPEGLGPRTRLFTVRPARTVAVPGSASLLGSAEPVNVRVRDIHGNECSGAVRRPSVLAALIGKAAATTIAVRTNRSRDTEDAALLLSILPNPRVNPAELGQVHGRTCCAYSHWPLKSTRPGGCWVRTRPASGRRRCA